jgi:hypothetical protein
MPVLLLAGCGGASRPAPAPETADMAACREEARAAAAVTSDLARRQNINNSSYTDRLRVEQSEAEARAYNDCLRRRGVLRGGGVERVRN